MVLGGGTLPHRPDRHILLSKVKQFFLEYLIEIRLQRYALLS